MGARIREWALRLHHESGLAVLAGDGNLLHVRLNHFLTIRLTPPPCRVNLRPLEIFIGNFSRPRWAAFSFASLDHRIGRRQR